MATHRARLASPSTLLGLLATALALAAAPKVPEGFEARLVAAVPAVSYPCQVATEPGGGLFVAEDPMDQVGPYASDHGRILLFKDGNDPVVFAEGFRAIFGMAWHDGALYVMNMPRLSVLRDADGDGRADSRKELFTDLGPGPREALNDHIVSGLSFGMDGRLYISVGDKGVPGVHGPDGRTAQIKGGGVLRCRPDGTGIEVFSTGTRNHLEANLDARDHLFTYDNTDDGDGWWTRITHHVDGGYYGYPYDYHARPDRFLPRMAEYGGGSPCGGVVYEEDAWPAKYRGRAFWAEWGKRHVAAVAFAPEGASFKVADYETFIEAAPGEEFRPIDLALSHDGKTLYVADWGMGGWGNKSEKVGRVYAITYKGPSVATPRGKDSDPIEAQIRALSHPSFNERKRAQAALIRAGAVGPARAALAGAEPVARRHLVWVLEASIPDRDQLAVALRPAVGSPDAEVRAEGYRALGIGGPCEKAGVVAALANGLRETEPTVLIEVIIAAGRVGARPLVDPVMVQLRSPDLFVARAARVALRRIGDWGDVPAIFRRAGARGFPELMATLQGEYTVEAVSALGSVFADRDLPPGVRASALGALAEVAREARPWDGQWWGTRPSQGKPPAKTVDWKATPSILSAIHQGLADRAAPVRLAATRAVREASDRPSLATLRTRFPAETDADVRREAVVAFGALDDREALPILVGLLRDPKAGEAIREAALASVETIKSDASAVALIELLGATDLAADRRVRVVAALGRLKAKAAVGPLVESLASPVPAVRAAAVAALAAIGETSATPKVRPLLSDPAVEVRKAAIVAVGSLKDRESIPALLIAADADATRFEATIALAKVPDVRSLQVHLRGLTDRSQQVRKASSAAIAAVRDQALPAIERLAARKELSPAALPELRKVFGSIRPVLDWKVAGTFPETQAPPFALDTPVDTRRPIVEGDRSVAWRDVKASESDGEVNLLATFPNGDQKSAFGTAELSSGSARTARMTVGSDDTLVVWVNGKQVYEFDGNRGFSPDSAEFDVALKPGANRLVIRCGNGGGQWQFAVGVSDAADQAFLRSPAADAFNPETFRAVAIKGQGKADHGRALFNDPKGLACAKCHAVGGQGGAVGPDLSGVGVKYPREELIASVLYPSRRISSGYEQVILATDDGRTIAGIIKAETPDSIEVEDAEARRVTIKKADLDGRKPSDVSLMPNGLAEGLTPADFADLVAYLESLREASANQGTGKPPGR